MRAITGTLNRQAHERACRREDQRSIADGPREEERNGVVVGLFVDVNGFEGEGLEVGVVIGEQLANCRVRHANNDVFGVFDDRHVIHLLSWRAARA